MYNIHEIKKCRSSKTIKLNISECLLENIGKPVFHRYTQDLYGSWMQVNKLYAKMTKDKRLRNIQLNKLGSIMFVK